MNRKMLRLAWLTVLSPLPVLFVITGLPIERVVAEPTRDALQSAISTCADATLARWRECRVSIPTGRIDIRETVVIPKIAALTIVGTEDGSALLDCVGDTGTRAFAEDMPDGRQDTKFKLGFGAYWESNGYAICIGHCEGWVSPPDPCDEATATKTAYGEESI